MCGTSLKTTSSVDFEAGRSFLQLTRMSAGFELRVLLVVLEKIYSTLGATAFCPSQCTAFYANQTLLFFFFFNFLNYHSCMAQFQFLISTIMSRYFMEFLLKITWWLTRIISLFCQRENNAFHLFTCSSSRLVSRSGWTGAFLDPGWHGPGHEK